MNCPFTGKYERGLEVVVDVYHRAVTIFDRLHDARQVKYETFENKECKNVW